MASKEYNRQYYLKNREKMIKDATARNKLKRATDPAFRERELERGRLWRKNNPEKMKACRDNWIANNEEQYREMTRAHSKKSHINNQFSPNGFVTDLFHRVNRSAAKGGHKNTMTRADIENLIIESDGVCALSGVKLSTLHNDPNKASVDRINSNKGYVKGNIRLVTTRSNIMKNQWTDAEVMEWCKSVLAKNGYKVSKK